MPRSMSAAPMPTGSPIILRAAAIRAVLIAAAAVVVATAVSGQAPQPATVAPPAVALGDLTWPAAEQRLKADTVVVLPLGAAAVEHGPHLKLRTDAVIADYFTRRLMETADVVVAPPIAYHHFPAFLEYPGSTSVALTTARDYTADIARSLARSGARRFYVLNPGRVTTQPLAETAKLLAAEGILLRYTDPAAKLAAARIVPRQPVGVHADEIETSMMLYIEPSSVQMSVAARDYTMASQPMVRLTRREGGPGSFSPSGVWGDATLATRELGRAAVESLVAGIRADVEDLRRAPLPIAAADRPPEMTSGGAPMRGDRPARPGECLPGDDRVIRSIGTAYSIAWSNLDAGRLADLWALEGDMIHPDGLVEGTQQAIRQNRAALFAQREYQGSRHPLTIGVIRCLTSDIAVAEGRWELRGVVDQKGQPMPPSEGLCTLVLQRSGVWKIQAYRYNMKPTYLNTQPTILKRPGAPEVIR